MLFVLLSLSRDLLRRIGWTSLRGIFGFRIIGKLGRYPTWLKVIRQYRVRIHLTVTVRSLVWLYWPTLFVSLSVGCFRRVTLGKGILVQVELQVWLLVRWVASGTSMSLLYILAVTKAMADTLMMCPLNYTPPAPGFIKTSTTFVSCAVCPLLQNWGCKQSLQSGFGELERYHGVRLLGNCQRCVFWMRVRRWGKYCSISGRLDT